MANDNLKDIWGASYSGQDVAFTLQHGNFTDFRRNLVRENALTLPTTIRPGRLGGDYRYGHVVEMMLHMRLSGADMLSREGARAVVSAGLGLFKDTFTGLRNYNLLPEEEKEAIRHGSSFSSEEDPFKRYWFVDFPWLVFGEDNVSRDQSSPTYWAFNPARVRHTAEVVMATGATALADVHKKVLAADTMGAEDEEFREALAESCQMVSVINLTELFVRLENRLRIRLKANKMKGIS